MSVPGVESEKGDYAEALQGLFESRPPDAFVVDSDDARVAHLFLDCPAVQTATAPIEPLLLEEGEVILDGIARLQLPLCGQCQRMLEAAPDPNAPIVDLESAYERFQVWSDRIVYTRKRFLGRSEITTLPLRDVSAVEQHGPDLLHDAALEIRYGEGSIRLTFDTAEERDELHAELVSLIGST